VMWSVLCGFELFCYIIKSKMRKCIENEVFSPKKQMAEIIIICDISPFPTTRP
jgi:hypothetical protein